MYYFHRELKEPLIPWSTTEELMLLVPDNNKMAGEEEEKVMTRVLNVINKLPQPNKY